MTIDVTNTSDIRPLVGKLINDAVTQLASDMHLEPTADAYELRYRVDELLQTETRYDIAVGRSIVTRLMVLAQVRRFAAHESEDDQIPNGGKQLAQRFFGRWGSEFVAAGFLECLGQTNLTVVVGLQKCLLVGAGHTGCHRTGRQQASCRSSG